MSATYNHCVKSVRIRSFSGPDFPTFGLVSLRIQSKCGKIRTRKAPNTDTCHRDYHILKLVSILPIFSSVKRDVIISIKNGIKKLPPDLLNDSIRQKKYVFGVICSKILR